MGIEGSKPLERKPSRTKSNLAEKTISNEDICEFTSQLNSLASLGSTTTDKLDYIVFQKLPFSGKFTPLPFCSYLSTNYNSVFICYDCSSDDHAYLCENCFEKGGHEGHRFSVFPNNDGWNVLFCRCGDYQFIKKNTICQTHKEVKKLPTASIDQKQKKLFSVYFQEIFKTLFSLVDKNRQHVLLASLLNYIQKITDNNLFYSKIFCQFLLEKNIVDGEHSNMRRLMKISGINNLSFFRNLSFVTEYKIDILREIILALNQDKGNLGSLTEIIINFSGKTDLINQLAKQQNIIFGINREQIIKSGGFNSFYTKIIDKNYVPGQIWKCIVRNKLVKPFIGNHQVISTIIKFLNDEGGKNTEMIFSMLQQLLQCPIEKSQKYIIPCLMIIAPECFLTQKSSKQRGFDRKIQSFFANYYSRIFASFNTHAQYENSYASMFVLLPFFNFGEATIDKFWDQLDRRINILQKNKQKAVIKQATMNYFEFLTKVIQTFLSWEHIVVKEANNFKIKSYIEDRKLIEKLLRQNFDKDKKILRLNLLTIIDNYTQKERSLAAEPIKKFLRYNAKKQKYYYIGDKLQNNLFNYEDLKVQAPLKLSQWQQFVSKKVFTSTVFKIVPKLIKIAQRGLMEDIQMVKTVSNISIALTLLNKTEKKTLKDVTRTFIKEIPDVRQDVYYVLAGIRDRLQLDIDDLEQEGMRGKKKVKLDLITEIRDKKYRQMKEKQEKILKQWQKKGVQNKQEEVLQIQGNICHICKEKDSLKNRFVYPCNFTRNNIISTLLKSQVTDLDINICLHKVHEECYEKIRHKNECPVCKFKVNCYIPEIPLADQSFTKNWLRNFENIVTTINLQSGKSFNSDWATIFLTYLIFSRSFKVLLKNTEIQTKQRSKADSLIMLHYRSQLQKWSDLTKQSIKRAEKTVKGQITRQSNIKKVVKSLSLDLIIQQITQQPFKNEKRIQKKLRQLVNMIGHRNSEKITDCFEYCQSHDSFKQILENSLSESEQEKQLFKIRQFSPTAKAYLQCTSIKCPMCGKYQPQTWECLFCSKISCSNCMNVRFHCERDHRGSSIILFLNNAQYALWYENREIQRDSLYRNDYSQGWRRNLKPQGWKLSTDQIYNFFDTILHSLNPNKIANFGDDDSDDGRLGRAPNSFNALGSNPWNNNQMISGGIRFLAPQASIFGAPQASLFEAQQSGLYGVHQFGANNSSWNNIQADEEEQKEQEEL